MGLFQTGSRLRAPGFDYSSSSSFDCDFSQHSRCDSHSVTRFNLLSHCTSLSLSLCVFILVLAIPATHRLAGYNRQLTRYSHIHQSELSVCILLSETTIERVLKEREIILLAGILQSCTPVYSPLTCPWQSPFICFFFLTGEKLLCAVIKLNPKQSRVHSTDFSASKLSSLSA